MDNPRLPCNQLHSGITAMLEKLFSILFHALLALIAIGGLLIQMTEPVPSYMGAVGIGAASLLLLAFHAE